MDARTPPEVLETQASESIPRGRPDSRIGPFRVTPLNERRWKNFKANRRGYWSFWIFLVLFVLSLFAEFIANDKPILISYKGELLTPIFVNYPEEKFGGFLPVTDYRDPVNIEEIEANGWMVWPPIRYNYRTRNNDVPRPAPSPPSWLMEKEEACRKYDKGVEDPLCTAGNLNWLGTDDQARDVTARMIYGFRISVLFGLSLTIFSAIIGISAGAVQGYYGGWTDLLFQRFIEIWSAMPFLYLLIILSSILPPGFWVLLGIMLLFSWTGFVSVVRAEFLRGRNFEYINAARALGVANSTIMFRHLLPNAMVATLTFLPFVLSGSIGSLTALDFLGFGLPPGSPSLGEMVQQARNNLQAWWLAAVAFLVISIMLSLLVFIGEATRDAFDPRKTFK
ncbi:MAG: ABC transporter permease [Pseudomonadota bacterium]